MGMWSKVLGIIGAGIFVLAIVMMRHGIEPFTTYFYCFAWWSYILIIDALIYRIRGESLLFTRTRAFFLMVPLSIFIWSVFEGFNLRLDNWHYIDVPHEAWKRWLGYAISYGTVLPGLCTTAHLIGGLGILRRRGISLKRLHLSPRFQSILMVLGGVSLIASLLLPRYFFPCIWIGFALLIDPISYHYGGDCLLRDIEQGNLQRLITLLTGGLVCGLLWELWNFWAQTKWIYTVPFFERYKVFEMPVLGFLGFPPFSVSAYVIYRFLLMVKQRSGTWVWGTCWPIIILFCCLIFAGIDRYTVISHIPLIRDMPGVQETWKVRLQAQGIEKARDLLQTGEIGLISLGIPLDEVVGLIHQAELLCLKGVGIDNYRLLKKGGILNLSDLAQQDPSRLYVRLKDMDHQTDTTFTPSLVRLWVMEAKRGIQ